MANSKYEYVKDFEVQDNLLPLTWIVIRIDGRGFSKCALLIHYHFRQLLLESEFVKLLE